ncbi:MAG: HPr family phosphocarrier protein [Planctomycetia bacterium]|nr:HPr family phosphocarrier protein [Planctomycetia bacterium]
MPSSKAVRRVTLSNAHGLHMRPASQLSAEAQRFPCDIRIACGDRGANAKSILSLCGLAAECGSELVIEAHGRDSTRAVECLQALVIRQFLLSTPDSEERTHESKTPMARAD